MALPTYLELVNDVLARLREPEVSTVEENNLSALVAKFINDGKRVVEDSYSWNALFTVLPVTTVASTSSYSLTGSGDRFKVDYVYDATHKNYLQGASRKQLMEWYSNAPTNATSMNWYCFTGLDTSGDTTVSLYNVPAGAYTVNFGAFVPQADLSVDASTLKVPKAPVVQWAFARALVERGEDGGLASSEQYQLYKNALSDAIAIECSRYPEEETWEAT